MNLTVIPAPQTGTEDVVLTESGAAYTGTKDGSILKYAGGEWSTVANTGGRPVGIELASDGRLLVCDSYKGLLWVDPESGEVEVIVADIDGVPMKFCNNSVIASDGTIWFTDSSTHVHIDNWRRDFAGKTSTGRFFRLSPDGAVTKVLDGLGFANGVALPADESFVLVAATGEANIRRLWLKGDKAGQVDFFVEQLPGYPDNIARGTDGLIWVTIGGPRMAIVTLIHRLPAWLRKPIAALPAWLQPPAPRIAWVQAYDDEGNLVHDLREKNREFYMVSGVREHNGRVWLSAVERPALAVIDR